MSQVIRFRKIEGPSRDSSHSLLGWIHQHVLAFWIGIGGFSTAVILLYAWRVFSLTHVTTDNAYVESLLSPVNSRMMGFIKTVHGDESAPVKQGDILVEFDTSDIQIEMGVRQAKLKKAEADFHRAKKLRANDAISESDFELAEANSILARAEWDGVELKQSFGQIRSPCDGTIAKLNVQPGQFVQPGQTLMLIVPPPEQTWIRANIKETLIRNIRTGQDVHIHVDAFPSIRWNGKVLGVFPSSGSVTSLLPTENASGNFTKVVQRIPVKISIEHQPGILLRPGMSAQVTIVTTKEPHSPEHL